MSTPIHYPPSLRPTLVRGSPGLELFATLKTKNCSRADGGKACDFCGLGLLDGNPGSPLGVTDVESQVQSLLRDLIDQGVDPKTVLRLSLIGMTDSLLSKKTIHPAALLKAMERLHEALPAVSEISIETRADMVARFRLLSVGLEIDRVFGKTSSRGIVCGIESHNEAVRLSTGKGITDSHILRAASLAASTGFDFRGWFTYNLLEREPEPRARAIVGAVDFMADVATRTGADVSILVLRGYVPAGLEGTPRFRGFQEVDDRTAIHELRAAAERGIAKKVRFEVDSTCEDQDAAGAVMAEGTNVKSPAYIAALVRYNQSLDPEKLRL